MVTTSTTMKKTTQERMTLVTTMTKAMATRKEVRKPSLGKMAQRARLLRKKALTQKILTTRREKVLTRGRKRSEIS